MMRSLIGLLGNNPPPRPSAPPLKGGMRPFPPSKGGELICAAIRSGDFSLYF